MDIRVSEIVEIHKKAQKSKRIIDKSEFERIFAAECREITGKPINITHIKEGYS